MPYTPPAARSPTASRPTTPKDESYQKQSQPQSYGSKQELSHSNSSKAYLSKHRRSPSISDPSLAAPFGSFAIDTTAVESRLDGDYKISKKLNAGSPQKQRIGVSEPPTTSTTSPNGSPQQSSSDEETDKKRGRVREFENLAELQAAIRIIEQRRSGSPDINGEEDARKTDLALGLAELHGDKVQLAGDDSNAGHRQPLTNEARKISHSRSSTDVTSFLDLPKNPFDSRARSASASDDDDEDDLQLKPSLIRKKSGELVRPALRASSMRRRPSSMPGTPTYSKAVHFQDNGLEHVRHFLQVDRPIAVSAGTSPVESNFEDENEFPFPAAFDWEMRLTNFPNNPLQQLISTVKVEKVYLSTDTKILIGTVAVRNLAFHKLVVARFTLDYWRTTSEVVAEYNTDIRKRLLNDGLDRFTFNIKLEDQANLESKTMFFCVRYNVDGQEHWDNNNNLNYQLNFSKKFKHGSEPRGVRQLNTLSRSKPTGQFSNASPNMRPRSMPSFDDFTSNMAPYEFSSSPNPLSLVGDSPIRYRNKAPTAEILPDAPGKPKSSSNHQAFGNRYDFGASLSAAMSAKAGTTKERVISPPISGGRGAVGISARQEQLSSSANSRSSSKPNLPAGPKPAALTSEKPSMQSPTYEQLLSDYCFVRTRPGTSDKIPVG